MGFLDVTARCYAFLKFHHNHINFWNSSKSYAFGGEHHLPRPLVTMTLAFSLDGLSRAKSTAGGQSFKHGHHHYKWRDGVGGGMVAMTLRVVAAISFDLRRAYTRTAVRVLGQFVPSSMPGAPGVLR